MSRFVDYINFPKNIKKYFMIRKMEKYSKGKKNNIWIFALDILIALLFVATFYYVFFINTDNYLKIAGIISMVFCAAFFIMRITVAVTGQEKKYSGMETLMLMGDDGKSIKTWNIKGKTSLLIGKGSNNNEVDVDLSDTEFGSLVSRQHAVLNMMNDDWYIEDIESVNGCGLKKANETSSVRMEKSRPYKLESGDIIYIAKTKLLIK